MKEAWENNQLQQAEKICIPTWFPKQGAGAREKSAYVKAKKEKMHKKKLWKMSCNKGGVIMHPHLDYQNFVYMLAECRYKQQSTCVKKREKIAAINLCNAQAKKEKIAPAWGKFRKKQE